MKCKDKFFIINTTVFHQKIRIVNFDFMPTLSLVNLKNQAIKKHLGVKDNSFHLRAVFSDTSEPPLNGQIHTKVCQNIPLCK